MACFFKLFQEGLNGKTWRIIRALYKNFKCCVQISNQLSPMFEALQGIHQGAPFSMFLYKVFGNGLLKELKQCMAGACLGDLVIAGPAYADDITLIAVSKEGLQRLFSIAYKYGLKWRFQFNPTKCVVVPFGKDDNANLKIKMGNVPIRVSNSEPHLGILLSNSHKLEEEYLSDRIASCKTICQAAQSIGSHRVPVSPVTASKIYKQVCIPKLCYGMEVLGVERKSMEKLESFNINGAKQMQALPNQTGNPGAIGTLGWNTIETQVNINRLLFLWRLLLLPITCIYKIVILRRFTQLLNSHGSGPTANFVSLCRRYDFLDTVMNCIESGEYMEMSKWKKM